MPVKVRIPPSVVERIHGVEPSIVEDVQSVLRRLADRPKLGTPVLAGDHEGKIAYEFRINRLPITRVFTLLYEYDQDVGELDVVDFGILDGSPPKLTEPTFRK